VSTDKKSANKILNCVLIALIILTIFFLQYIFRSADDNRLTSWEWAFARVDLTWFVVVLSLGMVAAYIISRSHFFQRMPATLLFLFAFVISMLFWREPELLVDTSRYFTQAKHLELYGVQYFFQEWGKGIFAWTDLPLVSFLYGLVFTLLGESRLFIQIFTTVLFALTCVLVYFTGKKLWDEETGFLAGILLLAMPYLFSQIPQMLIDVPTMFFLALSIFTFLKAMEKGGNWVYFSSIAIFSTIFSKYSTWIMLSVLPVIWLVSMVQQIQRSAVSSQKSEYKIPHPPFTKEEQREILQTPNSKLRTQVIFYRGISVLFITGIFAAIVISLKFDVIVQQLKLLQEYQAPGLDRWGESFISTFLFQVHPIITIAALYAVYEAFRKRDLKFVIISWLMLLIVILQIRRSRYVFVTFPMLSLMAAYGLQRIKTAELRRFIAFGAVFSALIVAIVAYLPFLQNMSVVNISDAGMFLNSVHAEEIRVFTIPSDETIVNLAVTVPMLDLFTVGKISYRDDSKFSPPTEEIRESPLRFTWEFQNPGYYGGDGKSSSRSVPVVVISNGHITTVPDDVAATLKGYRKNKVFDTSDDLFGFNPFVTVYLPEK